MTFDQVIARIRRALMLDESVFAEVREDVSFTLFSIGCTAIGVLLAAIGAWLWADTVLSSTPDGWFMDTVVLGTIFTTVLMIIGVIVMYFILSQAFAEKIQVDAFLRVAALAHLPFALGLLIFIPEIGFALGLAAIIATFHYVVFAIRAAYPDIGPKRVILAVLIGFAVWAVVLPLISGYPDNNWATGIFVYSLSD